MINLAPLTPLSDPCRVTSGPMTMRVGYFGSCSFIVTQDSDGHTEASLSVKHGRPTDAQAAAFFKRWGVEPLAESKAKGCRFWIVAKGTAQ